MFYAISVKKMCKIKNLEKQGLTEALGIEEKDLFEAKTNLLGFFEVLNRIDERLKKEGKSRKEDESV